MQRRICLRGWRFSPDQQACTIGDCVREVMYPAYGSTQTINKNSVSSSNGGTRISTKYSTNSDIIWEGSGDGDDFIPGLVGPDGNFLVEKPKMASEVADVKNEDLRASLAASAKRGDAAEPDTGFDNEASYDAFFSQEPRKASYAYEEEESLDIEDQLLLDYLVYNLGVLPVK